jgi:hypothetical protein
MKICQTHWDMMRASIEARGMSSLIATSGEAALANEVAALQGEEAPFDPLMSMHWFFTNEALRNGGLYLLTARDDGTQFCPVCEFEKHARGFVVQEVIDETADRMREHAVKERLIPGAQ